MTTITQSGVRAADQTVECSESVYEIQSRYTAAYSASGVFYVTRVTRYGQRPVAIECKNVEAIFDA